MQDMMATSHPSLAGIGSGQERSGDKLLAESQVSAHTSVTTEPRKKLSKRERKKARQAAAKAAQLAATQGKRASIVL